MKQNRITVVALAMALLGLSPRIASAQVAPAYSVINLGVTGYPLSASAINDDYQVGGPVL